MKRVVLSAVVAGLSAMIIAQAQSQGPGQAGVVKQPWDTTPLPAFAQPPKPTGQNDLPVFAQTMNPASPMSPAFPHHEGPDPNADITVQESHGPYMVLVHWYMGPDAPKMAREFVMELRNTYKLPAFVFNKGNDERKKEYERVKAILDQQKEFREKFPNMVHVPGRIKMMKTEDQCAVLVGGYKDFEAAEKARDKIRKLDPPDPNRVKLATTFYQDVDQKTGQQKTAQMRYVNPFQKAMPVRNPVAKHEQRPAEWDKVDMAVLKKLNRDEPFSLLECKKPFTLAIKQFHTPTTVQPTSSGGKFMEALGLSGKASDKVDTAALNAHNMADLMRKTKIDAYVLHTKFASIVTVGAYESPDDPALRSMQRHLTETYRLPTAPMPMQVPK